MANPEHLAILQKGVEKWNHWRLTNKSVQPDLSGINMSLANLSYSNLIANLSRANLSGANLSYDNLGAANLSEANLSEANLSEADLNHTNLSRANLTEANLNHANANDGKLSFANLSRANLSRANLSMAGFFQATTNTSERGQLLGECGRLSIEKPRSGTKGKSFTQLLDDPQARGTSSIAMPSTGWKFQLLFAP